jgi:NitT/TauT family transport system substrate-binding protein
MQMIQSRRRFLATLSAAGAAGIIGAPNSLAQEAPPETTTIRLAKSRSVCIAPLRAEGFSDIRYVASDAGIRQSKALASGEIDLTLHFSPPLLIPIDAGDKITMIAGVHVGCFELLATERIRSIADLKGKTVGVPDLGTSPHVETIFLQPARDLRVYRRGYTRTRTTCGVAPGMGTQRPPPFERASCASRLSASELAAL